MAMNTLHDQLKLKLVNLQSWKEKHEKYLMTQMEDIIDKGLSEMNKAGTNLERNFERYSKLIEKADTIQQNYEAFIFQKDVEGLFKEEEIFTASLTKYTREQFAGGVAELASSKDKTKYEMLDTNRPETFLGRGADHSGKNQYQQELKRLQSVYLLSKRNAIAAEMSNTRNRKAVEVAERQLKMLKSMNLDVTAEQIGEKIEDLLQCREKYQSAQEKCFITELVPLLERLQILASTKVIQGNYDLKLLRQDYFVSKQDEVINQLLYQFSRNYYLAMVYEIEYKQQRGIHDLFSTLAILLEKEVKNLNEQINSLNDILAGIKTHSQVIYSNDKYMNLLHQALISDDESKAEIYRSHNQIIAAANDISFYRKQAKLRLRNVNDELAKKFISIDSISKRLDKILQIPQEETNEELSSIIVEVEENLSVVELQINDVIKDLMDKKTLLSVDNVEDLKRKVWTDFFNDPGRLKRNLENLTSKVEGSNFVS